MGNFIVKPHVPGAALATMHDLYHELDPDPRSHAPEITCILCKTRKPLWDTLTGSWSIIIIDARVAFLCGAHWPKTKADWYGRFNRLLPQIRAELAQIPRAYEAKLAETGD